VSAGFNGGEAVWSGGGRLRQDALEGTQCLEEQSLGGEALGERDPDPTHSEAHLGAELEQTYAQRPALGVGQDRAGAYAACRVARTERCADRARTTLRVAPGRPSTCLRQEEWSVPGFLLAGHAAVFVSLWTSS